jgi:hypothetical protein
MFRGDDAPPKNLYYQEKVTETNKAWLLDIQGEEIWIPKSQCDINEDDHTIEIPEWLADKKGLEYDENV